jgi:DNA-binding transcriptional LysR family regulator
LQLIAGEEKQAVETKPGFSSNYVSTLRQLAVGDMGIALLPDYLCQQQVVT